MSAVIVDPREWAAFATLIVQEFLADLHVSFQGVDGADETIRALQHFVDHQGSSSAVELGYFNRIADSTLNELIDIFCGFESKAEGLGPFCRSVLDALAEERDRRQPHFGLPVDVT